MEKSLKDYLLMSLPNYFHEVKVIILHELTYNKVNLVNENEDLLASNDH